MTQVDPEQIQFLAQKLLRGTISDDERMLLEQWYDENPAEKPIWELRDKSKEALEERLYQRIIPHSAPVKRIYPSWARVAAAAAVLMVSAIGYVIFKSAESNTIKQYQIAGTSGHIRKVLLPDKSIVWLKGNSRLEYPSHFSDTTRNVVLHGEALFEVAKDRKHPFIIAAGNYFTRVLGTSFNIKEDRKTQSFKLTVLTGKVSVIPRKTENSTKPSGIVMVTPGKEFDAQNATAPALVTEALPTAKATVTQGTEYLMDFENIGFNEIKSRIEHKFDVVINVGGNYRNCALSADLTDQSLENTLKVICAAIGASYSIDNNKITITGGGCN